MVGTGSELRHIPPAITFLEDFFPPIIGFAGKPVNV